MNSKIKNKINFQLFSHHNAKNVLVVELTYENQKIGQVLYRISKLDDYFLFPFITSLGEFSKYMAMSRDDMKKLADEFLNEYGFKIIYRDYKNLTINNQNIFQINFTHNGNSFGNVFYNVLGTMKVSPIEAHPKETNEMSLTKEELIFLGNEVMRNRSYTVYNYE